LARSWLFQNFRKVTVYRCDTKMACPLHRSTQMIGNWVNRDHQKR
jgi:hypothetical protein